MHCRRRLACAVATGGIAAVAGFIPPTHALAGSYTQYCYDNPYLTSPPGGGDDVPILTGQGGLWIGLEAGALGSLSQAGHLVLCVSTSPPSDTTNPETFGESVNVNVDHAWNDQNTLDAFCVPDATSEVTVQCQAAASPTLTPSPGPCGSFLCGGTAVLTLPFTECLGSSLTGTVSCDSETPGVSSTGVLIVGLAIGPPPGIGTVGASVTVASIDLRVDGIDVPVPAPLTAGAGVGPGAASAGSNNGGAWVGTTNTVNVVAVTIDGTAVAESLPTECVATFLGASCPQPY